MSDARFLQNGVDKRTAHVVEEIGETLAALGKVQRWGWLSVNPLLPLDQQETNLAWYRRESQDLREVLDRLDADLIRIFGPAS